VVDGARVSATEEWHDTLDEVARNWIRYEVRPLDRMKDSQQVGITAIIAA
jgi:hypothetical protein